jgi:hypothetical protein
MRSSLKWVLSSGLYCRCPWGAQHVGSANEDSFFSLPFWLGLLLLAPALASLVALGLKWLLLLFVLLFSQVLAGVVWIFATFGGLIAWLSTGLSIYGRAQQIDALGGINTQSSSDASQKPPTG